MRVIRSLLWFIVGVLLALVAELSYASFPATYAVTDQGWNFCGPYTTISCAIPNPKPGLSYSSMKGQADNVAAAWTGKPSGYTFSGPSSEWPASQIGINMAQRNYKWVKSGYADFYATMLASRNGCPTGTNSNDAAGGCKSTTATCPANSTVSGGTCTCNTGYNENSTSGTIVCSPPCPSDGTSLGAYWMPEGTTLSAAQAAYNEPSQLHCMSDGCYAAPSVGSQVALGTYLVDGVTNYDITYSSLSYLGEKAYCTPGTSPTPIAASKPTDTCGADKYLAYDANKKAVCYNADGTAITPTGPAVACGDVSDSVPTVNGDGSTTVETTIKDTCTGKTSTTSVTYPAGTTAVVPPHASGAEGSLSPGGVPIGGTPGTSGGGADVDPITGKQTDSTADFCAKNPTVDMCKTTAKGTAATVTGIYTPDSSGKTFASSIGDFKTTIQGSGLYSAATGFITAGTFSGSCSDLSVTFDLMGRSMTLDAGSYLCGSVAETLYTIMATGLMLMATLAAYKIAIL